MNSPRMGSRAGITVTFCGALMALASTGCQVTQDGSGKRMALFARPGTADRRTEEIAENGPMYRVEIVPANGRGKAMQQPLTEGLTVQQAIDKAGASRQFKKMKIEVVRIDPTSRQQIKMGVQMRSKKKRVMPSYDYSLMPGDRVVIKEDTSTTLDAILGPLSGIVGR